MKDDIASWIKEYARKHRKTSLVVGVSGGIDSAVVSTLCAMTGINTIPCSLPIDMRPPPPKDERANVIDLAMDHLHWLDSHFPNINGKVINMTNVFRRFWKLANQSEDVSPNGFANSRARMRMMMLYQIASSHNALVVGTGNKVEDFGVGFFTKWGDGGADISPIGDLYKSEVYELGASLNILNSIMTATPMDGLWDDDRSDEKQLGLTYDQLEEAMKWGTGSQHYDRYVELRTANLHKMQPIPVFKGEQHGKD